jgi:hypothetical protein
MAQPIRTPVGRLQKRLAAPKWLGWSGPIWSLRVGENYYHFRSKEPGHEARSALLEHVKGGGWLGPATLADVIHRCGGIENRTRGLPL